MYTACFSAEHFAGPERAAREPGQDAVLDATALGRLKDVLQEIRKPRRRCSLRGKRTRKNTGKTHKANVHARPTLAEVLPPAYIYSPRRLVLLLLWGVAT